MTPDTTLPESTPDADRAARIDRGVTRAAGIVSLGNVLSSGLGLIREMVKSRLFGATGSVSAYNVAALVPSMLYDLLVGGLVSSALVPLFSEYAAHKDRAELWRLVSLLLSIAIVFLSLAVLVLEFCAPAVARIMAGGFDAPLLQTTTDLLRLTLPAVLFLSLSSVLSGVLYALKRFAFPAFAAPLYNASTIVVAILLADRFGIAAMALGLLAGSILQVAFQLPALRGAAICWRFDLHDPALRKLLRLYAPVLGGLIIGQVAIAISMNLASRTGASGIALMDYPTRLIQFPLGLIVSAVSIAILPSLSRHAALNSMADFKATLAQGLRLVLVLIIPAAIGLAVLAPNIVQLLYEHGAFTPADTQAVTLMLWLYLIGLIFAGVDQPLVFAFYARKDTLTPAVVGLICNVGIYLFMAIVPPALSNRPLQVTDLAIANSVQWMSHALIMLWLLRYRLGGLGGHGLGRLALKAVIGSLAMAVCVYGAITALVAAGVGERSIAREATGVIGAAVIGAAIYLGALLLLRAPEIRSIGRLLLRRRVA
jgi:putative peptidoglycan lipid II flippase